MHCISLYCYDIARLWFESCPTEQRLTEYQVPRPPCQHAGLLPTFLLVQKPLLM
jgi:hypothetical protein